MNKTEYLSLDCFDYLPDSKKDRARNLNARKKYIVSESDIRTAIGHHKAMRSCHNYEMMAEIEYRFSDINFHSFVSFLRKEEYENALHNFLRSIET